MFDLKRGLTDLGAAPRIDSNPIDVDRATGSVRRRRAVRSAGVAAASAAAVVGIAAVAWAVGPWSDPHPPADPGPTVEPAPTTPEPTPDPTAPDEPTQVPDDRTPPIVGLTEAGELVLVDPGTGEVLDVVTATALPPGQGEDHEISVDWNNRTVYLSRESDDWPNDLVRISLDDGTAEVVGKGFRPAVSADGSTLTYLAWVPGSDSVLTKGPRLVDVAGGQEIAYVPNGVCGECGYAHMQATWSPDGSQLVIPEGGADGPSSFTLAVVDVHDLPATLRDVEQIGAPSLNEDAVASGYYAAQFLADGSLAAIGYDQMPYDGISWRYDYYLAILEDGQVRERIDLPEPAGSNSSSFTLGSADGSLVVGARSWFEDTSPTTTTWLWSPGEPLTELPVETPLLSVTW